METFHDLAQKVDGMNIEDLAEIQKLEKKSLVSYIYIGSPRKYGEWACNIDLQLTAV
ncbi:hypothetical protein N9Y26_01380 [bacterium]|nr:hypothetical protein [bacterium]